mmetsp:Transcript_157499/g.277857  ORF Transcript_157499/g.277857 Transcript_157499/m.277857 type:complete len:82 (-) Transcript_157499:254-499(-)
MRPHNAARCSERNLTTAKLKEAGHRVSEHASQHKLGPAALLHHGQRSEGYWSETSCAHKVIVNSCTALSSSGRSHGQFALP